MRFPGVTAQVVAVTAGGLMGSAFLPGVTIVAAVVCLTGGMMGVSFLAGVTVLVVLAFVLECWL